LKSDALSNIGELNFYFFYFKENPINNSKGIILNGIDTSSRPLPIGQFECFFINFNKKNIQRAKEKNEILYELSEPFKNENIYRVTIVDTNICFKNVQSRVPFYAEFINETIKPNYSFEEKLNFLSDSIKILQNKILLIEERIIKLEERFDKINFENKPIPSNKEIDNPTFLNVPRSKNRKN
jgi:hypothetical protein